MSRGDNTHLAPPIDPLDTRCHAFQTCLKCAKTEYSQYFPNDPDKEDKLCIPEFIMGKANKRYKVDYDYDSGVATCTNNPNSCERKSQNLSPIWYI